ncbi:hypothetical protein N7468_008991 [Penicillium chermesinum]|uniref:protein-L-isoaspartate(D-aspartate) O-methyltransferase n=1 Tax=Penicillium chermesinum TaxID=63820 RepID=A0A9W9NH43_9EURO|nr:uncharacterized protein N7468_008991 [Penicillium chermesinum]KAJ5219787.1 hypothetical protein N7468_008991 [Penicillium chermesinum]
MAWYCSGSTNTELVENLFKAGLVKNDRVKEAMLGPTMPPSRPYSDSPQPIGHGATISAPHMHGHACEYLIDYLQPGARVLDIGSGSGYLTHVIANLVANPSNEGLVIGVDHIPALVELSRNNMNKSPKAVGCKTRASQVYCCRWSIRMERRGPLRRHPRRSSCREASPGASRATTCPGRLFIPVESEEHDTASLGSGQWIWIVDKKADGSVHKEKVFQVSYVPLTDAPRS